MEQVRLGIIGIGNMGTAHARSLMAGEVPEMKLTAVADVNPARLTWAEENLPGVARFDDAEQLMTSGLVDAVLVAVPHYFHPPMVISALGHGLHAISEKPAGVYTKAVREMNEVAAKSDKTFAIMFNQRTNCVYRKMREIIATGGIGQLQRVNWIITNWYRTQYYYDTGSWRATWKGEGGGVLINQAPHQLDLIQWVLGEMPVKVRGFCGYGKWHDIEVEDDVTAYFEYANGATGVFITTTGEAPGVNRFEVVGTLGSLICENDKLVYYKNAEDSHVFSGRAQNSFASPECKAAEVETDGQNPQHAGILNNFARAILGKEALYVDGKEGVNGVELMNAIEYSGWHNGEEVALPVDGKKYLAELNKRAAASRYKSVDDSVVTDNSGSYGSTKK